jgi:hypothetical protein
MLKEMCEVVEFIELINVIKIQYAAMSGYELKDLMEKILTKQEELGMSPPETLFGNLWHRKWEPEDTVEVLREERERLHSVATENMERKNNQDSKE